MSTAAATSLVLHVLVFAVLVLIWAGTPDSSHTSTPLVINLEAEQIGSAREQAAASDEPSPLRDAAMPAVDAGARTTDEAAPAAEPVEQSLADAESAAVAVQAPPEQPSPPQDPTPVAVADIGPVPEPAEAAPALAQAAPDIGAAAPAQPLPAPAEAAPASGAPPDAPAPGDLATVPVITTAAASARHLPALAGAPQPPRERAAQPGADADPGQTSPAGARAVRVEQLSEREEQMLERKFREWTENYSRMKKADGGITWKHRGREYAARFIPQPAEDEMGLEHIVVEITTEEEGQTLTTQMRMKRLAFSHYAQFVNRWDPNVAMHEDEMDGRFHSNSEISVSYADGARPTFRGKVTTAARNVNLADRRVGVRRQHTFLGGLETGVRAISLPRRYLPFPERGEVDEDQVHRFETHTRIRLHGDGSYSWQPLDGSLARRHRRIAPAGSYLLAEGKVRLHVAGTVNGKVLIYSPHRIVIEGHLVYAEHPNAVRRSDDYLGLVSDKDVEIAPPEVTGPGNLFIHAAIYAKRRFAVRRYSVGDGALLYVYGSVSAGSMSASEPRYATRIEFDRRLEELRPPGFPMTDRYSVVAYEDSWTVQPANERILD